MKWDPWNWRFWGWAPSRSVSSQRSHLSCLHTAFAYAVFPSSKDLSHFSFCWDIWDGAGGFGKAGACGGSDVADSFGFSQHEVCSSQLGMQSSFVFRGNQLDPGEVSRGMAHRWPAWTIGFNRDQIYFFFFQMNHWAMVTSVRGTENSKLSLLYPAFTQEVFPNFWLVKAQRLSHVSVLQIWWQWCHRFNFSVDALVTRRSPSVLACRSHVLQRQHIQRRPADRTSLHPLSTDLPCFHTSEMGNSENRAASVATFFVSKYRTDKHSFADLDNTKCKSLLHFQSF